MALQSAATCGPRLSAWGRMVTSGFDGQVERLSLNGPVTVATLGSPACGNAG